MIVDSSNAQELTAWRKKQAYSTQTTYKTSRKAQYPASVYCSFQSDVSQETEGRRTNFFPLYKVQPTLAVTGLFVNSYRKEKPHKTTLFTEYPITASSPKGSASLLYYQPRDTPSKSF